MLRRELMSRGGREEQDGPGRSTAAHYEKMVWSLMAALEREGKRGPTFRCGPGWHAESTILVSFGRHAIARLLSPSPDFDHNDKPTAISTEPTWSRRRFWHWPPSRHAAARSSEDPNTALRVPGRSPHYPTASVPRTVIREVRHVFQTEIRHARYPGGTGGCS
ncbi:hypothetical protein BKA80DRAFT_14970 [Phyllosticta citrichinensis]